MCFPHIAFVNLCFGMCFPPIAFVNLCFGVCLSRRASAKLCFGMCVPRIASAIFISKRQRNPKQRESLHPTCSLDVSGGDAIWASSRADEPALAYRIAVSAAGICWHLRFAVQLGAAATSLRMPCRLVHRSVMLRKDKDDPLSRSGQLERRRDPMPFRSGPRVVVQSFCEDIHATWRLSPLPAGLAWGCRTGAAGCLCCWSQRSDDCLSLVASTDCCDCCAAFGVARSLDKKLRRYLCPHMTHAIAHARFACR